MSETQSGNLMGDVKDIAVLAGVAFVGYLAFLNRDAIAGFLKGLTGTGGNSGNSVTVTNEKDRGALDYFASWLLGDKRYQEDTSTGKPNGLTVDEWLRIQSEYNQNLNNKLAAMQAEFNKFQSDPNYGLTAAQKAANNDPASPYTYRTTAPQVNKSAGADFANVQIGQRDIVIADKASDLKGTQRGTLGGISRETDDALTALVNRELAIFPGTAEGQRQLANIQAQKNQILAGIEAARTMANLPTGSWADTNSPLTLASARSQVARYVGDAASPFAQFENALFFNTGKESVSGGMWTDTPSAVAVTQANALGVKVITTSRDLDAAETARTYEIYKKHGWV